MEATQQVRRVAWTRLIDLEIEVIDQPNCRAGSVNFADGDGGFRVTTGVGAMVSSWS